MILTVDFCMDVLLIDVFVELCRATLSKIVLKTVTWWFGQKFTPNRSSNQSDLIFLRSCFLLRQSCPGVDPGSKWGELSKEVTDDGGEGPPLLAAETLLWSTTAYWTTAWQPGQQSQRIHQLFFVSGRLYAFCMEDGQEAPSLVWGGSPDRLPGDPAIQLAHPTTQHIPFWGEYIGSRKGN